MTPPLPTHENWRHEVKFLLRPADLNRVELWLRGKGFRRAFPDRTVNSLYFDTPALKNAADTLAGVANRVKLRLRYYGKGMPEDLFWEIKEKRGRLNCKTRVPLANLLKKEGGTPVWLRQQAARNLPPLLARMAAFPTVGNSYRRSYWALPNRPHIRLTLDHELRAMGVKEFFHPAEKTGAAPGSVGVVEIKAPAAEAEALARLLADFPLRISRSSKYVDALSRFHRL